MTDDSKERFYFSVEGRGRWIVRDRDYGAGFIYCETSSCQFAEDIVKALNAPASSAETGELHKEIEKELEGVTFYDDGAITHPTKHMHSNPYHLKLLNRCLSALPPQQCGSEQGGL